MGEASVSSIARFFFFAFMDDRRAIEASTRALLQLNRDKKKNLNLSENALIVKATFSVWNKFRTRLNRGNLNYSFDGGWIIPEGLDIGPWREFQRQATVDELLVIVWSKILNFSEADVARGLGVSEGTIRYRLGKALRKLGGMAQRNSINRLTMVDLNG